MSSAAQHALAIAFTGGVLIWGVAEITRTIAMRMFRIGQALRGEDPFEEVPADWLAESEAK